MKLFRITWIGLIVIVTSVGSLSAWDDYPGFPSGSYVKTAGYAGVPWDRSTEGRCEVVDRAICDAYANISAAPAEPGISQ